jgi:hypothetical protein
MPRFSHPRFDLDSFSEIFRLTELRDRARDDVLFAPSAQIVTSPFHLTLIEQLRREVLGTTVPVEATPVDAFVFGAGEPAAPYLTKVGGYPFRSRRKPWPTASAGRPLGFVGQLSFIDSTDLVPDLPGDLLLVFVDPENPLVASSYAFEWIHLSEEDPMSRDDMPEVFYKRNPGRMARKRGAPPETRKFEPFPCYGVIHRTFDLPGWDDRFAAYAEANRLSVLEATKIGGVPHNVQTASAVPGRFVASLASIQPAAGVEYPWVNEKTPLSLAERHAIPTWKLGDMGSLYFFGQLGRVVVEAQSY